MTDNVCNLAKRDAARCQLAEAIRLFFQRRDPVAIHTLAAAAHQILYDLCCSSGRRAASFMYDEALIRPEKRECIIRLMREAQNFLKHADRDPNESLEFHPDSNRFLLLDAVEMWRQLGFPRFNEELIFRLWMILSNPECVADEESTQEYEALGKKIDFDINDFDDMLELISMQGGT